MPASSSQVSQPDFSAKWISHVHFFPYPFALPSKCRHILAGEQIGVRGKAMEKSENREYENAVGSGLALLWIQTAAIFRPAFIGIKAIHQGCVPLRSLG